MSARPTRTVDLVSGVNMTERLSSNARLKGRYVFLGITGEGKKTVCTVCNKEGVPITSGLCSGRLDFDDDRQRSLQLVLNVIDNAVHASPVSFAYNDLASIVIGLRGNVSRWVSIAVGTELKNRDTRLRNVSVNVLSDLDVEIARISQTGSALLVNSDSGFEQGIARNGVGQSYRWSGPNLSERLPLHAIQTAVERTATFPGLNDLSDKLVRYFHLDDVSELENVLDFFDPDTRAVMTRDIVSIVASAARSGNMIAHHLCTATVASYVDFAKPVVRSLELQDDTFPISLTGDMWEADDLFKEFYLDGLKCLTPGAYLARPEDEIGLSAALLAIRMK